ncbi:MAG: hypothetical protein WKG07_15350 [Hymenobacter sp.]
MPYELRLRNRNQHPGPVRGRQQRLCARPRLRARQAGEQLATSTCSGSGIRRRAPRRAAELDALNGHIRRNDPGAMGASFQRLADLTARRPPHSCSFEGTGDKIRESEPEKLNAAGSLTANHLARQRAAGTVAKLSDK